MQVGRLCVFALFSLWMGGIVTADDWSDWRGPNRGGESSETNLLRNWPQAGPPVAWQVDTVGQGYSAVVICDGRAYTQGDIDGVEHVIALRESDGTQLWAVQPAPVAVALTARVAQEFARLDTNNDARIDDLEGLRGEVDLKSFFAADPPDEGNADDIAARRVSRLFRALDSDQDGILLYGELPDQLQQLLFDIDTPDKKADAIQLALERTKLLMKRDENGDSFLDRDEVHGSYLERYFFRINRPVRGEKRDDKLSQDEILAFLQQIQPGKDGQIELGELTSFYRTTFPGRDGILEKSDLRRAFGGYRDRYGYGDGPRGSPVVDGDRVYVEGGNGDVSCLDAKTGETVWHVNLVELGGEIPVWGYSESPLVLEEVVIVTPGGDRGAVAALNKKTGEVVWRSSEIKEPAQYRSAQLVQIHGRAQIVQFCTSVFALDPKTGERLWQHQHLGRKAGWSGWQPIVAGNRIIVGDMHGTESFEVDSGGSTEVVYTQNPVALTHGGAVIVAGCLYGASKNRMICMDAGTGKIQWRDRTLGKGSVILADGMLFYLGENHKMGLVDVNPERFTLLASFPLQPRDPQRRRSSWTWTHPVIANGRLYIRNYEELTVYDIKQ